MPIFEYACTSCGQDFETLVRANTPPPACPHCQGIALEKLISRPAIKSEGTHGLAMKAAKKRDQKSGSEMARAQREYELHHND